MSDIHDMRDAALHAALDRLADGHEYMAAPPIRDPQTGAEIGQRYIPCSGSGCHVVFRASMVTVSGLCSECVGPCETVGCGLLRYQHVSGGCEAARLPCEMRAEAVRS